MLSINILSKTLTYLDKAEDIEKLDNINNELNRKLRYIYKNGKFNFKYETQYFDIKKFTSKFKNIHTLKLKYNTNITDEGLKYLSGIHTLHLWENTNITDEGLKYLSGIHTLNLVWNKNITDDGLKYLSGIHTLDLGCNENITDDGLKYLSGIHTLNIEWNKNITDCRSMFKVFKWC